MSEEDNEKKGKAGKVRPIIISKARPEKKEPKHNLGIIAAVIVAFAIILTASMPGLSIVDPGQVSNITWKVNVTAPLESNGAIPINVQDQTTPLFDAFFSQLINRTSLADDTILDSCNINAVPGHGIEVNDYLVIFGGGRVFAGEALVVNVNNITVDTPINAIYLANETIVSRVTRELNVDGDTDHQIFIVTAPVDVELDVTRIMIYIEDNLAMDDGKFGGLDPLANGLVFRLVNNVTRNYWNIKSNGEIGNLAFDATYTDKAPAGQNSLRSRYTMGGQSKHGVVVRLGGSDQLQIIVQDDLSALTKFRIIAEGHVVTD